jgi:hypothetical protein
MVDAPESGMWKALYPCFVGVVSGLILGCSSDGNEMTRGDFCDSWAERACTKDVASICQAKSQEDCQATQAKFCIGIVPETFTADAAKACLDAVKDAYSDADLTRAELDTVLRLGPPCDALAKGASLGGGKCEADDDCETASGYRCVIKGGKQTGSCEVPEVVDPGLKCSAPEQVCTEGFFCNGTNCVEALAVGESCVNHAECGPLGFCSGGACADRFELNDECSSDEQCASGICYAGSTKACVDRVRLSPAEPLCKQLR